MLMLLLRCVGSVPYEVQRCCGVPCCRVAMFGLVLFVLFRVVAFHVLGVCAECVCAGLLHPVALLYDSCSAFCT